MEATGMLVYVLTTTEQFNISIKDFFLCTLDISKIDVEGALSNYRHVSSMNLSSCFYSFLLHGEGQC